MAELFSRVMRLFGLDLAPIYVWRPTREEQFDLKVLVTLGDRADLRKAMLQSVASSKYDLTVFADADFLPDEPTNSYGQAQRRVQQMLDAGAREGLDEQRKREVLADFFRCNGRYVIQSTP